MMDGEMYLLNLSVDSIRDYVRAAIDNLDNPDGKKAMARQLQAALERLNELSDATKE